MSLSHIVIIGAGQAGANAILELRAHGYEGNLTLIGDEPHLPYERPPLSKEVILTPGSARVEILSAEKLEALKVTVITGNGAERIDPEAHLIELENGETIGYDKLLIATGGAPRRLPMLDRLEKQVYTLRNLEDARKLVTVFTAEKRIVLVGGGVIGLELASSASAKGCRVTVLEQESMVMKRCAPAALGEYLVGRHRAQGIDIRLATGVTRAEWQGEEIHLSLQDDQTLVADAVVYGIGIVPNVQLATTAGLEVDGAILIDKHCQSSHPDIYAAGDVAARRNGADRPRRIETWENANNQAAIFARHVLALEPPAARAPWFWTDQLGINVQFVGDMAAAQWHVRGDMAGPDTNSAFSLLGVSDGTVVAGITVNQPREMRNLKKMVDNRVCFQPETHLDTSRDLRKIV
ncbi:FAD-dependent oxidoreductase [Zobellella endophytica]|uniref:FAD-dependent oxidoreductase n=1 Tax=Zobellella endophytica TaxID=2116700 RepID=A0A2P7R1K0_9GAMM|nr:3-phenylpropionate/cinnamic acid dioxygenase ferredoxin--NAD(+) reductase subunit [Zobellella endophytica]PSJ44087.1 FAD-dependent oxidoreductase [Zobellella endophytica]